MDRRGSQSAGKPHGDLHAAGAGRKPFSDAEKTSHKSKQLVLIFLKKHPKTVSQGNILSLVRGVRQKIAANVRSSSGAHGPLREGRGSGGRARCPQRYDRKAERIHAVVWSNEQVRELLDTRSVNGKTRNQQRSFTPVKTKQEAASLKLPQNLRTSPRINPRLCRENHCM